MRIARWSLLALLIGCGSATGRTAVGSVAVTDAVTTPATDSALAVTTTTAPSALALWVAKSEDEGRVSALVTPGFGTDARMATAFNPNARATTADSRVLLADGTFLELPPALTNGDGTVLAGVGTHLVLVGVAEGRLTWWLLNAAGTAWDPEPDAGVAIAGPPQLAQPHRLGDMLLVTYSQTGLLFSPDLTVQAMATPPEPDLVPFTTTLGSHAFTLGKDYVPFGGGGTPLTRPWEFDATANTWVKVPIPAWVGCAKRCNWSGVHESGDLYLEATVGREIVKLLPDQSVGAYDVDTRRWRRLNAPSFSLSTPSTALLGDHLLVVAPDMPNGPPQPIGIVGVLDVTTGHWATTVLPIDMPDANWTTEMHAVGDTAFLRLNVIDTGSGAVQPPEFAFDLATNAWRNATAAETAAWPLPEAPPDPVAVSSLLG